MKKLTWPVVVITLVCLAACTPASSPSTPAAEKITLEDAPAILSISFLLPSRFEQIDAATEGMSNEDIGLGSDCSEVQLYVSENPFQMIYGFIAITESSIERAMFDSMIEDESQMEAMIADSILAGVESEGLEATVPNIDITHPDVGDSALGGEGDIESYGLYFGFDCLFFRSGKVYTLLYSLSMSSDKVPLVPIAKEIEKRISEFPQ